MIKAGGTFPINRGCHFYLAPAKIKSDNTCYVKFEIALNLSKVTRFMTLIPLIARHRSAVLADIEMKSTMHLANALFPTKRFDRTWDKSQGRKETLLA